MQPHRLFHDRVEAGQQLAEHLRMFRERSPIVLGLPRGGVPVANEVARELGAPLDICVVRKLGAPQQPELGMGAVAEGGMVYVDVDTLDYLGLAQGELAGQIATKRAEVDARVRNLRHGVPPLDIRGRTVILVDDGIATGGTVRAALQTLRVRGVGRVVVAVPVAAPEALRTLESAADEIVCLYAPQSFRAVGAFYRDFTQTTDEEVVAILESSRQPQPSKSERVRLRIDRDVRIPASGRMLAGHLTVPSDGRGVIIFAHGSGSSRNSPRNLYVASQLQREGFGTLLLDLLTAEESGTEDRRFDIALLSTRLAAASDWIRAERATRHLPIGYFGASTGAAAALIAAASNTDVAAVVSRGGRTDLADVWLGDVRAPTLLIVGSADDDVLQLNRRSLGLLDTAKDLYLVDRATHLFEEPGALDEVAAAAARWFERHLTRRARTAARGA